MAISIDAVLFVVQFTKQSWMRRGNMIAFQVVVDIDLPVTIDDVIAPPEVFQFTEITTQLSHTLRDVAEDTGKRCGVSVEVHENKRAPRLHPEGRQAHSGAVPILHALELRLAQQPAIQRIRPAMIRAAERAAVSLAGCDGAGPVPANVAQGAQRAFGAANDQQRLAGDVAGKIAARLRDLTHTPHRLPGSPEDFFLLETEKCRIDIPEGRQRSRARKIRLRNVIAQVHRATVTIFSETDRCRGGSLR